MAGEMRVWLLTPTGPPDARWSGRHYLQKIVVRAKNQPEARRMAEAATAFPTGREKAKGRHDLDEMPLNPWRNPDVTSCHDVLEGDVEPGVIAIQNQT